MTGTGHVVFQNVYVAKDFYRRLLVSLSEPIRELVICTPYIGSLPKPWRDIVGFCLFQQKRGVDTLRLITRAPGADTEALPVATARLLAAAGVDIAIRTSPFLHAKLYHLEYRKGYFRTFIGSSNFTLGGLQRNDELVAELEGVGNASPFHREIQRLLYGGGTLSYQGWMSRQMPKSEEEAT